MSRLGPRAIIEVPSFRQALRVQMGVIGALMMRELHSRFGRKNVGFVWLFIEPAILGLGVSMIRMATRASLPGGMEPLAFFTMGYVLFYMMRTIVTRAATTVESNASLLAHARVTVEDLLVARSLLEMGAATVAGLVFVVMIGIVLGIWPHSLVQMGIGFLLMGLLCHGFAAFVLSLARFDSAMLDRVIHPLMYFSIIISGVFFMVWWLPKPSQEIVLLLPFVHVFEFMREGQFGPGVPYHYDLAYLLVWILGINVYGGFALRRARPHLEV